MKERKKERKKKLRVFFLFLGDSLDDRLTEPARYGNDTILSSAVK